MFFCNFVLGTKNTCTLTGGEIVQTSWSGKDSGGNDCNICVCDDGGVLSCTEMNCGIEIYMFRDLNF